MGQLRSGTAMLQTEVSTQRRLFAQQDSVLNDEICSLCIWASNYMLPSSSRASTRHGNARVRGGVIEASPGCSPPSCSRKESCRTLTYPRVVTLSAACSSLNHTTATRGRLIEVVGHFPASNGCSRAAFRAAKDKGLVEVGNDGHSKRSAIRESLPLELCAETSCRESERH